MWPKTDIVGTQRYKSYITLLDFGLKFWRYGAPKRVLFDANITL